MSKFDHTKLPYIIYIMLLMAASALISVVAGLLPPFASFLLIFSVVLICLIGTYYHYHMMAKTFLDSLKGIMPSIQNKIDGQNLSGNGRSLTHLRKTAALYESVYNEALLQQRDIKQKLSELERINLVKNQTLDTLLRVNHLFLELNDSYDYYTIILQSAVNVIEKGSKGSILVLNPETQRYEYATCLGYQLDELRKVTMSLEETFLYMNAGGNYDEPIIIRNVRAFDAEILNREYNENLSAAGGLELEEAISAPIIIDGVIFAIINIDSEIANAFDEMDKQLIHFFATQIAIALKNKYMVDETIHLSRYDKLTGALNRNYFEKILSQEKNLMIENMENYALVLCDLNYLKMINDTFGHGAGDEVLKQFTKLMQKYIRETDIISRIGGDEFVILLRSITAQKANEKMLAIFNQLKHHTFLYQGHELPVSFSYGIACAPDDSMIYDVLIKIADLRMYEFKELYKKDYPEQLSFIQTF